MVGDENPPENRNFNSLTGLETEKNVEQIQRSSNPSVSPDTDLKSAIVDALQPRVREAALWLHLNRSAVTGNVLVILRRKFTLTIFEATDAAQAAHRLTYR